MDENQSVTGIQETSKMEEMEKKLEELTRTNSILKANISTLYRTARAEFARKDDRIAQLQSELDDLIFKRLDIKSDGTYNKAKENDL